MTDNLLACGIVLTTFNDLDISLKMLETLPQTMIQHDRLFVVDGGSKDGGVDFWNRRYGPVFTADSTGKPLHHLSVALNVGINAAIKERYQFVAWIHADMKFNEDERWLTKLIKKLHDDPSLGKVSPECVNDSSRSIGPERPGNSCPWVMRSETLLKIAAMRKQRGGLHSKAPLHENEFFNERYVGIGGREDWDLNNFVIDLGLKVIITPDAVVWHEGMGTRKRRDTNAEAYHNADLHQRLHGTTGPRV